MSKTRADQCLDCVNAAINHAIDFAPDAPLERFLAQEIAEAKAQAYEEAGWWVAAQHWRAAVEALGEMDIETRLKVAEAKAAPVGGKA
jgi:hypothetical protein